MKKDDVAKKLSISLLYLYIVLGLLDAISCLVPMVIVSYGLITVISVAFIVLYFLNHKEIKLNIASTFFLLYCVFFLLSSAINKSDIDRFFVGAFAAIQIISVALACINLKETLNIHIRNFIYLIAIFAFAISFLSLASSIITSDTGRITGITPNPNTLGGFAGFGILASMIIILLFKKGWKTNILAILSLLVDAAVLARTESRTALLASLASVFVLFMLIAVLKNRKAVLATLIVFIIIAIAVLCLFPRSIMSGLSGREEIWKTALTALTSKPILGFGGNTESMYRAFYEIGGDYPAGFTKNHLMHNIYIQVAVEYGIIAFFAFFISIAAIAFKALRKYISCGNYAIASMLSILSFALVHGIAESSILYIGGPEQIIFVFSASACYALIRDEKSSQTDVL